MASDKNVIKLINVSDKNNNKFYIMTKLSNQNWEAQWGRVKGGLNNINECQKMTYSLGDWDKKYREKVKKGYEDVTHLYEEIIQNSKTSGDGISIISDSVVKQLIYDLKNYANSSIKSNYTISTENVTQKMIDEAQNQINLINQFLKDKKGVSQINMALLRLFKIIPRKMNKVGDYLLYSLISNEDFDKAQKFITNEQDTLDVMAGQVKLANQQKEKETETNNTKKEISILEQMGLKVSLVNKQETDHIKHILNHHKIKKVFKVSNEKTESIYNNYFKKLPKSKEELLWHGSRNQNWFNIIQTGLLIRPTGVPTVGAMFGSGIYFANKADKSLGYSSLSGSFWAKGNDNKGYLALYKVNVGKQKHIYKHDSSCYALDQKKLDREGFDSVYAHGGIDLRNDEFMIYQAEKCTIAYLVEFSN